MRRWFADDYTYTETVYLLKFSGGIYAVKMWFVLFFLIQILSVFADLPHHKFEYKYSFKGPYLAQKDGTVPFWEHFGSKYNLLFPAALVHVAF